MIPITKESLNEIISLSEVSISPDGNKAAYIKNMMSDTNNNYTSEIYLLDLKTKTQKQLTTTQSEKDIQWLDQHTLMFQSKKDLPVERKDKKLPTTLFYTLSIDDLSETKLFELPLKAAKIIKLSDETYALLASVPVGLPDVVTLDACDQYVIKDTAAAYTIFDELPFWKNGEGVTNKQRTACLIYDNAQQTLTRVSDPWMQVEQLILKAQTLYYFGTTYQDVYTKKSQLYTYDITNKSNQEVSLEPDFYLSAVFIHDKKPLLYGRLTSETDSFSNSMFYVIEDDSLVQVSTLDISIGSTVGSDCRYGANKTTNDHNALTYIRAERVQTGIFSYQDGIETPLVPLQYGAISGFDIKNDVILYIGIKDQGLQELYSYNLKTQEEHQLTYWNDHFLAEHSVSKVEYSTFENSDHDNLDCFVLKPINFDPTQKYPAILYVRGGPKGISGDNFFHELQLHAARGYFVFYTNPRGSDGRGSQFADIEGARYGQWDYQDLMELVDVVIKRYPAIDDERVGIMGGSYGGFMTNWVIGNTHRFKAAVSQRSIANYVTKCLTTDIGYYHNARQMGNQSIWENVGTYWQHSPLRLADRVTTPCLIMHSDEDYRCYMGDALQFFTALKLHGVPTRFCLFHQENHELSRNGKPANRYKRLEEVIDWFDQYLK